MQAASVKGPGGRGDTLSSGSRDGSHDSAAGEKRPSGGHLPGSSQHSRSVHLTPEQWQLLTDYHEHDLFVRTRSWGFCMTILALGVTLFGIGSPAWKYIGDTRHGYTMGLLIVCPPQNSSSCRFLLLYVGDEWKIYAAAFSLIGCTCLFGILGMGLAVAGACRSALTLRLYYYHSAGECFLVSMMDNSKRKRGYGGTFCVVLLVVFVPIFPGICLVSSLILYPRISDSLVQHLSQEGFFSARSMDTSLQGGVSRQEPNSHSRSTQVDPVSRLEDGSQSSGTFPEQHFAYTFYLLCSSATFFAASFICMNLDLIIQSVMRPTMMPSTFLCSCLNYFSAERVACSSTNTTMSLNQPVKDGILAVTDRLLPEKDTVELAYTTTTIINNNNNNNNNTNTNANQRPEEFLLMTRRVPAILLSDYDEEKSTGLEDKAFEGESSQDEKKGREIVISKDDDEEEGDWI